MSTHVDTWKYGHILIILLLAFLSVQVRKSRIDSSAANLDLPFRTFLSQRRFTSGSWDIFCNNIFMRLPLYIQKSTVSLVAEIYLQLFGLSLESSREVEAGRLRKGEDAERMFLLFWQAWKWIHGKSLSYSARAIVKRETKFVLCLARFQRSETEASLTEGLYDKRDKDIGEQRNGASFTIVRRKIFCNGVGLLRTTISDTGYVEVLLNCFFRNASSNPYILDDPILYSTTEYETDSIDDTWNKLYFWICEKQKCAIICLFYWLYIAFHKLILEITMIRQHLIVY